MEYRQLGRAGVRVSPLCLGTMNFGNRTEEGDAFRIMDRALDRGINFFDTADVYGGTPHEGVTERIIGRWFGRGGRRDRIVLATKVYGAMGEGPNDRGLSAYHIVRACEASLERLGTDRIDLYQMHHVDRSVSWEEVWEAMDRLVAQGKVLYVGTSNFAGWQIAAGCEAAGRRHSLGPVSEQSVYHLANRTVELEVLPACRHYGLGVIPWSPLGGGLLAGALQRRDSGRRAGEKIREEAERQRARLGRWEGFCRERGEDPARVALAWLLENEAVTAPIIGPRTMEQLEGALAALDVGLDAEAMAAIDEIWPGPGGEAPEAYAF